jgi:hypothetical protein
MGAFVKANWRKVLLALLYAAATFVYIHLFDRSMFAVEERLWAHSGQPAFYLLLMDSIIALPISLLFSFNHLRGLFRQKVTVRIINLVVALLLAIYLYVWFFIPHSILVTPLAQAVWRVLPFSASVGRARTVVAFLFWYNLIFAFRSKELAEKKANECGEENVCKQL